MCMLFKSAQQTEFTGPSRISVPPDIISLGVSWGGSLPVFVHNADVVAPSLGEASAHSDLVPVGDVLGAGVHVVGVFGARDDQETAGLFVVGFDLFSHFYYYSI